MLNQSVNRVMAFLKRDPLGLTLTEQVKLWQAVSLLLGGLAVILLPLGLLWADMLKISVGLAGLVVGYFWMMRVYANAARRRGAGTAPAGPESPGQPDSGEEASGTRPAPETALSVASYCVRCGTKTSPEPKQKGGY